MRPVVRSLISGYPYPCFRLSVPLFPVVRTLISGCPYPYFRFGSCLRSAIRFRWDVFPAVSPPEIASLYSASAPCPGPSDLPHVICATTAPPVLFAVPPRATRACAHAHARARTHACAHTHARMHTHMRTHTHARANKRARTHVRTNARAHTHAHECARAHTCAYLGHPSARVCASTAT